MNTDNHKQILKKLLDNNLTTEEKQELTNSNIVSNHLMKQWDALPNSVDYDSPNAEKIFKKITDQCWHKKNRFYTLLSNYKIAASFALLILCSTLITLNTNHFFYKKHWNTVTAYNKALDSLYLPDGTSVVLNKGSKISYPDEFPKDKRMVILSGQAFFYVKHDKTRPFTVRTKKMDITALGTSFEVFGFDSDNSAETILLTGKIEIKSNTKNNLHKSIILSPNEKLAIDNSGNVEIEKVDANAYSAWRTKGKPTFNNEKLSMIIPRLEKWYGKKIYCSHNTAEKNRFTFTLHNESIEELMFIISNTTPLLYQKIDNHYIIYEQHN